ncbi:TonB-dependent receptor [Bacteroides sp. 519]|uniref:TonB-dependent receptor n=1 Tax=Bacteroides sp. 519 TaxID=2302937 RepID=UPI0013D0B0A0|nr:TonB-dependent receptor [Bacteroides sp. 519]
MRIAILLLFIIMFQVKAEVYSQTTQVSLNMKNASIEEILSTIEENTEFYFLYNTKLINVDRKMDVSLSNVTIESALKKIFNKTDVIYKIEDRQIILSKHSFHAIAQQNRKLEGTVKDEKGEPIIGATIKINGSATGTITDYDGRFSLDIPEKATLLVSYIGYITQTIAITNQTHLNIVLAEDSKVLDEVVVIGYGTMKKSDITGSVASVKVDELKEGVSTSVDQLLLGKSAGVNVVQNSGEPGGGFSINIRGASSVNAGNSPLYVIDGIPIDNSRPIESGSIVGFSANRSPRNPLSSINPSDIASIEILKDASATAIYGSRGANGVILITTKNGGKDEKASVTYQGSFGVQSPANKLKLLNATDYKRILNEIIDAGGEDESNRVGDIANNGKGTNWQDEVMNKSAIVHDHQISFTGGTKKTAYYVSLGYVTQEGIIKNTSFDRYSARINLKSDISDKLKIGINATGSYMQDKYVANGFGVNEGAGVMYAAFNFDPTYGVKDDEGNFITSPLHTLDNPVAITEGMRSTSDTYRFLASAYGEYYFTKDLFAKLNLGTDFMNESRKSFVSSVTKEGKNNGGIAANQNSEKTNYLIEGTLNYNKTFNIHSVGALAGVTYQRYITSRLNNTASDFPNESLGADNLGIGNKGTFNITNSVTGNRLASYIGRVNYSLLDTYLLTATLRADGSSRFGKNNRFGYFPSAALGWKMTNEKFLKDIDAITSMKLRLSWGKTGNQEIGNFPSLSTFAKAGNAVWSNRPVTGTQPEKMPNPDLKWETTEQVNLGLDFGFFNNRITGSIDYFRKKTTDMLLNLPVPQSTGFDNILSNIGRIDNNGFEFLLNTVNVDTRNFSWSSSITLSAMRNKVKDLGGIDQIIIGANYNHVTQVAIQKPGLPLNAYYGWEIDGIWQVGDDFSKFKEDYKPGDLKYVDQNGDEVIDDKDRVVLGNSFPDFQWSFGNTFTYKNLELFVFFEGVQGVDMLNGNLIDNYFPINFRRNKFSELYLNRWTPENPSDKYPSFVDPLKFGRRVANSKTVQDASYIRLRTIRLSYTVPKIPYLKGLQLYVTAENLFTITDYIGLDPAVNPNNNINFRMDFNAYPTSRTFMFGAKIDF